ncbi:MAG: tRNA-dihydrouridine synthase [Candidatus Pacebacteria bacterium]|jgi:nifR3 family TIM-barrel protein|nr:tRNA-dihydrouridine synthase [Candidatus Paceibacterota bacterium]
METNFWKQLKKPFFVLAPMADVTDAAFRRIIATYSRHGEPGGGPAVFWTEFVSADGLSHPDGREKLMRDLMYTEAEHPIVAQLFGSNPDNMRQAAALCRELGFDGIDINMGCPDKTIEKQGAGAACIKNPNRAKEIIRAAKEGAGDLPVSVKTRIGYNKNELETWLPALLEEDLAAVTIHARTRKEMSLVPARWEHIKRAVEIRDAMRKDTLILGNGDAQSITDARDKVAATGCDGVMLGRAIFGNPWLFVSPEESQTAIHNKEITIREKLRVMVEHTKLFEELLGDAKSFAVMKKHYKAYVNGFDGAKELRMELMEAKDAQEVEEIVRVFLARDTI